MTLHADEMKRRENLPDAQTMPNGNERHESCSASQPEVVLPPRQAVRHPTQTIGVSDSVDRISGQFVMAYPPGIPLLAPGERITNEAINACTSHNLIGKYIRVMDLSK